MPSAIQQINSIAQASAEGEITPEKLAGVLTAIYTECKDSKQEFILPDYLEKTKIDAIAQTASSALQTATSASGCTCQVMSADDFEQMRVDFGFINKFTPPIH